MQVGCHGCFCRKTGGNGLSIGIAGGFCLIKLTIEGSLSILRRVVLGVKSRIFGNANGKGG
jgi:hypothetical protein